MSEFLILTVPTWLATCLIALWPRRSHGKTPGVFLFAVSSLAFQLALGLLAKWITGYDSAPCLGAVIGGAVAIAFWFAATKRGGFVRTWNIFHAPLFLTIFLPWSALILFIARLLETETPSGFLGVLLEILKLPVLIVLLLFGPVLLFAPLLLWSQKYGAEGGSTDDL
jgi:hypothetical protein